MMETSPPGEANRRRSAGTVFLDALVALVVIAATFPAAIAGIGAVIAGSARIEQSVRTAIAVQAEVAEAPIQFAVPEDNGPGRRE